VEYAAGSVDSRGHIPWQHVGAGTHAGESAHSCSRFETAAVSPHMLAAICGHPVWGCRGWLQPCAV
jgi:hypothetical protein